MDKLKNQMHITTVRLHPSYNPGNIWKYFWGISENLTGTLSG